MSGTFPDVRKSQFFFDVDLFAFGILFWFYLGQSASVRVILMGRDGCLVSHDRFSV